MFIRARPDKILQLQPKKTDERAPVYIEKDTFQQSMPPGVYLSNKDKNIGEYHYKTCEVFVFIAVANV